MYAINTSFTPPYRRRFGGFSLLEVLIALVILSVGLLGIAMMVTTSLKANDSAYMRSQATALAYNIIDRMRINLSDAQAGVYNLALPYSPPITYSTACSTSSCAPDQLAQYDLNQWEYELNTLLPGGQGAITTNTSGGVTTVTVTVQWIDSRAMNSLKPTAAPAATTSSLSVSTAL